MRDATTFPTNESDRSSNVNKVQKIFVKPGDFCKAAKFFDRNGGKTQKITITGKELFVSTNNKFIASSLSVFVGWVVRDTYYRGMRLWISS